MRLHPQIITKNSIPEFVVLTHREYENILEALEDQEDIEEIKEFRVNGEDTIPFELLRAIAHKKKNAVYALRKFRKISQADLATKIGVSRQYLCQIEKGQRKGSSAILKKIADVLNLDVALLIT